VEARSSGLRDTLRVRIAQVRTKPNWLDLVDHGLRPDRDTRQRVMAEMRGDGKSTPIDPHQFAELRRR